ncbi:MAG: hypothetical protein RLN63_05175, partial [Miltoncostaeaceae bacterium]
MRPRPQTVAPADWSVAPARRWVAVAARERRGWSLRALRRMGREGTIAARLGAPAGEAPLLLGVDFAIGVPARWARAAGVSDFPPLMRAAVAGREPWERLLDPARTAAEIDLRRPFYP